MDFSRAIISFFIAILLSGSAFGTFPNYFLRAIQTEQISEAELTTMIDEAFASIIERVEIPYVADNGNITTKGFFRALNIKAKKIDPKARIYISGGVVRSILGLIYHDLYEAKKQSETESTRSVLESFSQPDKILLSLSVLGIGSDLDLLVISNDIETENQLLHDITKFINSAEASANIRQTKSKFKHSIVPIGDVKLYQKQLDRAVAQGGSDLDWLAFPISKVKLPKKGDHEEELYEQKMKMPDSHPDIIHNFIYGFYRYLPPTDPKTPLAEDSQTIRGLRPLLEIPFLHLSDTDTGQMRKELAELITKTQQGGLLSDKAMEQFDKMIRNARFEGAHNRFHSFTQLRTRTTEIEQMAATLASTLTIAGNKLPVVPEFLRNQKSREDPCKLNEKNLLLSKEDFIRLHTENGTFYHGTPMPENLLRIIRNGLAVSSSTQGAAGMGKGAYMGKKSVAATYGIPIPFSLQDEINPLIVDLGKKEITDSQSFKELTAGKLDKDLPEFFSEKCNVDIVIHGHILILNSYVIKFPKDIKDLISLYTAIIFEEISSLTISQISLMQQDQLGALIDIYNNFCLFRKLGETLGLTQPTATIDIMPIVDQYRKMIQEKIAILVMKHPIEIATPSGKLAETSKKKFSKDDGFIFYDIQRNLDEYFSRMDFLISDGYIAPELDNLVALIQLFLCNNDGAVFDYGTKILYQYLPISNMEGIKIALSLVQNSAKKTATQIFNVRSNFLNFPGQLGQINVLKKYLLIIPEKLTSIIAERIEIEEYEDGNFDYLKSEYLYEILKDAVPVFPDKISPLIALMIKVGKNQNRLDYKERSEVGMKLHALLPPDLQAKIPL